MAFSSSTETETTTKPASSPSGNKTYYVDNNRLLEDFRDYHARREAAKERGDEETPPIGDYMAEAIMKISERLSTRPNFVGYPFREDMVQDGVENCLKYLDNFNPWYVNENKPKQKPNPFAYISTIIWNAFLRRIKLEQRHLFTKTKVIEQAAFGDSTIALHDADNDGTNVKYHNTHMEHLQDVVDGYYFPQFEEKKKEAAVVVSSGDDDGYVLPPSPDDAEPNTTESPPAKPKGLELYMEEDETEEE